MKMTRRTTAKKTVAVVEPETTICPAVETAALPKREIIQCSECNLEEWRSGLCYSHWKESEGFVFDEDTKVYIRKVE
jgi:hypothetical protein